MKKMMIIAAGIGLFLLFAIGFIYCWFNYQFWSHLDTSTFDSLTEYNSERVKAYRGRQILIHRDFHPLMVKITRYAAQCDLTLLITQSYRIPGRRTKNCIVPPAVKSNHLAGHAVDFNIRFNGRLFESNDIRKETLRLAPANVKAFIGMLVSDDSLRWGGEFKEEDPVHVDDGLNTEYPEKWNACYRACLKDLSGAKKKHTVWIKRIIPFAAF